ncbi:MAG: PIN domain-containing protein [Candidatus Shapirobacteria bacterium]
MKEINQEIADWAAMLRRNYHIATPDTLQIATAAVSKAKLFVSNDKNCQKIKEIKVLVLKDYLD